VIAALRTARLSSSRQMTKLAGFLSVFTSRGLPVDVVFTLVRAVRCVGSYALWVAISSRIIDHRPSESSSTKNEESAAMIKVNRDHAGIINTLTALRFARLLTGQHRASLNAA